MKNRIGPDRTGYTYGAWGFGVWVEELDEGKEGGNGGRGNRGGKGERGKDWKMR